MNGAVRLNLINYDDSRLYSKCDKAIGLWEQVEMTSESEFCLKDTVELG